MLIKTINITVSVLVTLSVACVAVLFVAMAWHLMVLGGTTVYHLLQS